MRERKAKKPMSALTFLGMMFAIMGAPFLIAGILFLLNPTQRGAWAGSFMFIGIGGLFFFIGVSILLRQLRKRRLADRLMDEGRYVWGTVADLVPNTSVTINGRHPFTAVIHYADGSGTHVFRSEDLPLDADMSLLGKTVKVYVDGSGFESYHVDINGLLARQFQ